MSTASASLFPLIVGLAHADGVGLVDFPPAEVHLPGGPAPILPEAIPIQGPFRLVGVVNGTRAYEAPLPVRPRVLFFSQAPEGMRLLRVGGSMRYGAMFEERGLPNSWEFTADSIIVRVSASEPAPSPDEYRLVYPQAGEREASLHPTEEQAGDPRWPIRSAQVGEVNRRGVYLPVPSVIAWNVDVPMDARLRFSAGIRPAEIEDGSVSDGADLNVIVDGKPIQRVHVPPGGRFFPADISLAAAAGRTARIELRSAGADPTRDHLFVAEPQIVVPQPRPRRLVLIFVDTLRRDHLGTYGYTRRPAPGLDRLADESVVFNDARSVAPWTLPATRAALTGQEPEFWSTGRTLAQRLSKQGWATAAYVGNVYLSSNFGMEAGWGEHGCVNWPPADMQVDRGVDFLDRHADQDSLLMVHFMDLHLPYKEPPWYRHLYTKENPPGVGDFFTRTMLLRVPPFQREELKQYLVDRYDQNLRYVDDSLQRLLDAAGPDATIAFFADHGEEFFDHDDLEHGHTLYDELIRIPLFLRSPGLTPGRVDDPVSLLDLTPTLLDLLGMPDSSLAGRTMLPLARGEATATDRPIAFGRPLYGEVAWGVTKDGEKYMSREGAEHLYDLAADPDETTDLRASGSDISSHRAALAKALGRDVRLAYRISPNGAMSPSTPLEMTVPGGIAHAWVGDDPTMKSKATLKHIDDDTISVSFTSESYIQREVFVIPKGDPAQVTDEVTVHLARPMASVVPLHWQPPTDRPLTLAKVASGSRGYSITWAILPLPAGDETQGFDPEMAAALGALGYLTRGEEPAP